jgi:nitroreductase
MRYNISEISALIKDRRSIRPEAYSDRVVHEEMIKNVLNSAIWAPTHGMTQPWRFKVFVDEGLDKLSEVLPDIYKQTTAPDQFLQRKFDKLGQRPKLVSVMIAVCMERDPSGKIPEIEEIEAVACAVQNMSLHCTAYGLGSFWSSPKICYTQEMRDFLQLGTEDHCLGWFYMGYPKEEWPQSHRKPIEYISEWIKE